MPDFLIIIFLMSMLSMQGCANMRPRNAVPIDFTGKVTIRRGLDFNLAYIPADFKPHSKEFFDTKEIQRLFKRGYDDVVNGYTWHKTPPGYAAEDEK